MTKQEPYQVYFVVPGTCIKKDISTLFDTSKIRLSDAMETTEQSPVIIPYSVTTPASMLSIANPKLSPHEIIMNRSQLSVRGMPERKIHAFMCPRRLAGSVGPAALRH